MRQPNLMRHTSPTLRAAPALSPATRAVMSTFTAALMAASLTLMTVLALLVAAPQSAQAHDALLSTVPAEGSTVEMAPEAVTLTLSNPPSGIGAAIIVTDSAGTDWADGPVSITDNIATQPLRAGAPAGAYTVQWRVVSADSHPIEGTFPFTASAALPAGTAAEPDQGTAGQSADPAGEPATEAAADTSPVNTTAVIAVVVFLGALGIAALVLMTRKNLRSTRR